MIKQERKSQPLQQWKSREDLHERQSSSNEKSRHGSENAIQLNQFVFTLEYLCFPPPPERRPLDEAGYIQHRDATCTEKLKDKS